VLTSQNSVDLNADLTKRIDLTADNMNSKKNRIILSIMLVAIGILLDGFAFTTTIGHPISTICLLISLGLIFGGFILFIVGMTTK